MKTFKDYLEEISKQTYVGAMQSKNMTYDDDRAGDDSKIIKRAEREHGKKFASRISWVDGYGRQVGSRSAKDKAKEKLALAPKDKLAKKKPTRVTKSGKANKQDLKMLKKTMANEIF
jgi:hypothetical protein